MSELGHIIHTPLGHKVLKTAAGAAGGPVIAGLGAAGQAYHPLLESL